MTNNILKRRAIIFGIKSFYLTPSEKNLLLYSKPWGVILFSRNIKNILQLKNLVFSIKNITKNKHFPILIDQEGGKVSRINKIVDLSLFSQDYFGQLYNIDKKIFFYNYKKYIHLLCDIFKKVGININTVPVLDVYRKSSHNIIGTRSFSSDPEIVKKLGKICVDLYNENKIATVIKHMPGHGLSKEDSHKHLPIVAAKKSELIKNDFKPFKYSDSFFAMTAHVKYKAYDPVHSATHSYKIIQEVIRKNIGFKGIIISDDISMKALNCGLKNNAMKALDAGCNLVLHCNANINEMKLLTKIIPTVDKFTQKKTSQFYKFLG